MNNLIPQPGDLVVLNGIGYCRWAVYIGDDKIIHVTAEGVIKEQPLTVSESISKFVHVDNSLDSQISPFPAEEVVTRARQRIGELWNFDIFNNNSEHFAKWCRYGQEICQQVPYTYNTGESVGAGLGSLTLGPARVHGPSIHAKEVNEEEKTEIEFGAQVAGAEVGFVKVGVGPTVKAGTRDDTSGLGFTGEVQFAEVSAGPLGVTAGLGISSGFHNNDHGFGAQILGTGFHVCKSENGESVEKVGVSVLGNKVECSIM